MKKTVTGALLCLLAATAFAQATKGQVMPGQAETAEQQKAIMDALKTMRASNRSVDMNSNGTAAGSNGAGLPQEGRGPASNISREEFDRLAKTGSTQPAPTAPQKPPQADLMIFVSMSMPPQMLERYAEQAKRFKAVLMMRGFVGDKLSETRATLARLNKSGAQWEISPEPFIQFKIDKVPAIVMATADSASVLEDGCAKPETYTTVFGDLSVRDALDKMALRAQPVIATMAKARLDEDKQQK